MAFLWDSTVAVDTETTGLDVWHGDEPFAISAFGLSGKEHYVEFNVDPFTRKVQYDKRLRPFKEMLEDEDITKVFWNAKFDIRMLRKAGVEVRGTIHDAMYMAHCCNSLEFSYGLKHLAKKYHRFPSDDQDELQTMVLRCRRAAKKLKWNLKYLEMEQPDGSVKTKPATAADYWVPRMLADLHPDSSPEGAGEVCQKYAVNDVVRTMLMYRMYRKVMKQLGVEDTYNFEMFELFPVVMEMEERGVRIDPKVVEQELKECVKRIKHYEPLVVAAAWKGINLNSPQQLQKLFYEKLKLPITRYTDSGGASTDNKVMKEHRHHPVIQNLLKYKSAMKAFGSFFARYKRLACPDPLAPGYWVLHASFQQCETATHRFSCREPNLQNVASPEMSMSVEPFHARTPFGPRPGYVWLHMDYKGQEVRIFAYVSQEPTMMRAIEEGREIHDEITNKAWGGPGNLPGYKECAHVLGLDGADHGGDPRVLEVWKKYGVKDVGKLTDQRKWDIVQDWLKGFDYDIVKAQASLGKKNTKSRSKQVTFAKVYGGGPKAVAELIGISLPEARQFVNDYDKAMPGIQKYLDKITKVAERQGYIETCWGRRLTVDPEFAYSSCNYVVQGSAADLVKRAMVRAHNYFRRNSIDAHLVMTVHDEIVFEVRKEEFTCKLVKKLCALLSDSEGHIGVPMPVEASVAVDNWSQKKKILMGGSNGK